MIPRILYGGILEEILMRWGLVSVIVWAGSRISKTDRNKWVIIFAILASAILFGAGHLGAAALYYKSSVTVTLLIIGLNALAGLFAGWLFWKYSLEEAVVYHMLVGFGLWAVDYSKVLDHVV